MSAKENPDPTFNIDEYDFFQKLKSLTFIERIYLFGSRMKGTHHSRSDIDLAIHCPLATDKDWNQVLQIIENADTLLKIDCLRLDKLENKKLKQSILAKHQLIFEKTELP